MSCGCLMIVNERGKDMLTSLGYEHRTSQGSQSAFADKCWGIHISVKAEKHAAHRPHAVFDIRTVVWSLGEAWARPFSLSSWEYLQKVDLVILGMLKSAQLCEDTHKSIFARCCPSWVDLHVVRWLQLLLTCCWCWASNSFTCCCS